jgi:rod shape-determining protein MreC
VFVLAATLLMLADHGWHRLEGLRSSLSMVVYPLQWLVDLPATTAQWLTENLASRQTLLEENASLRAQYLLLKARLAKFAAMEAENMRLRELLESSFRFKVGEHLLIAEVSAVATDPYSQQVVVDKGTYDGIFVGQPVLDAEGVMGQVTHVAPLSSIVMLVTDPSHALPVQVNRNGLRSIAVGTGSGNLLELMYLPKNSDVRVGDMLVTSGLGGRFPPGYPVATVARVEQDPRLPFEKVVARPNAQLDRSREVLLVWPSNQEVTPEQGSGATSAAVP